MASWGGGYVTDVGYIPDHYVEQSGESRSLQAAAGVFSSAWARAACSACNAHMRA